jgi:hypothetical protein
MIFNSETSEYARVLGTALGYAIGLTGTVVFTLLAFVRLEHGAYPTAETTYAAVSYATGNAAAASDFYEIAGSSLLFLSVAHATRNRKVAYLWLVAGGSQVLGIGALPLYRASIAHYRIENIVDAVTFGTGAIPVAVPTAIVAGLLTIDAVQRDDWKTPVSRLRRIASAMGGKTDPVSVTSNENRWLVLSKLAGYLVGLVSFFLAVFGVASTSAELSQRLFEGSAFAFLAVLVYNAVSTESVWLLTLLGCLSVVVGTIGLQYGTAVSSLTLSAGVLLLVSVVSSAANRRRTSE